MTSLLASLMAPANGSPSSSIAILVFQFGAIILIFYFLLIRPQSMARKKHAEILAGLKKGDDVTTSGGIIGRVKDIKDDRVTIESGTSTLVVERGRIVRVGEAVSPNPSMATLDLHLLGSPVLRQHSQEISDVDADVRRLIDDLFETMDAAKGVGLAANQVGVARRVAVVGVDDQRIAMVNPVLLSAEGRERAEEGCLSIPDAYGDVARPQRVVLQATGRDGQPYRLEAEGLLARAIQHEIDHLDGILFIDHLGALKRQLLVARWKKEHRGEGVIKTIRPEHARPE